MLPTVPELFELDINHRMETAKNLRMLELAYENMVNSLQLHVGQENPDPTTDARAVPIYQTTSYLTG